MFNKTQKIKESSGFSQIKENEKNILKIYKLFQIIAQYMKKK